MSWIPRAAPISFPTTCPLKDFGTFTVEVAGSTANSLELKVVPE
jgi:hypothetical protein